jgi:hypothetical protein
MPFISLIGSENHRVFIAEVSLYAIPCVLIDNYSNRQNLKPVKNLVTILANVCAHLGVDYNAAISRSRLRPLVEARQLYCYIAVKTTGESLVQIAKIIGDRDHTTVIHSHRVTKDRLQTQHPVFTDCIKALAPYLLEITPKRNRVKGSHKSSFINHK